MNNFFVFVQTVPIGEGQQKLIAEICFECAPCGVGGDFLEIYPSVD
jgi:hypothetical protein